MILALFVPGSSGQSQNRPRTRDIGLKVGVLPTGPLNAITDVPGVLVGHTTLIRGDNIRTGVTAILPHNGNLFREKVPGAVFVGNGFGKLAGLDPGERARRDRNADPADLDSRRPSRRRLSNRLHARSSRQRAGPVDQSRWSRKQTTAISTTFADVTSRATTCLQRSKGAKAERSKKARWAQAPARSPSASKAALAPLHANCRRDSAATRSGVLVQSNFGGVLTINGAPVGQELGRYYLKDELRRHRHWPRNHRTPDGSIIMVVATDAPMDARNLRRLAARAMMGLGRTGGSGSNGSGDYVIAFSTASEVRIRVANQTAAKA